MSTATNQLPADVPLLSIVIPVYNGGAEFRDCLTAIAQSHYRNWELIVVDDGSTDQSAQLATEAGAKVIATEGRVGPGKARNLGAALGRGHYLCFIDADCEVHPDTLSLLAALLTSRPDIDAVFGSYDDAPRATNFVGQYKNLLHHYTHQHGHEEASTFWAGCGAVKRSLFLQLGGFDVERYRRPSIEDIDLGYRIRQAGGKIHLAKQVQVKHYKAWRLGTLIKTDVCDRGIPWTQLLLRSPGNFVNDLNLQTQSRMSVVAVYLLLFFTLISFNQREALIGSGLMVGLLLLLNADVYRFFYQKRGLIFMVKAIGMHWLYYFYSGVAFVAGYFLHWQSQWKRA